MLRAEKLNQKLALVLFDNEGQSAEVLPRLNKERNEFADAFRAVNEGAHGGAVEDAEGLVRAAQRLAEWVRGQR